MAINRIFINALYSLVFFFNIPVHIVLSAARVQHKKQTTLKEKRTKIINKLKGLPYFFITWSNFYCLLCSLDLCSIKKQKKEITFRFILIRVIKNHIAAHHHGITIHLKYPHRLLIKWFCQAYFDFLFFFCCCSCCFLLFIFFIFFCKRGERKEKRIQNFVHKVLLYTFRSSKIKSQRH